MPLRYPRRAGGRAAFVMCEETILALRQAVRLQAARRSPDELLRRMGYGRVNAQRRARLVRVLDDDLLGMDDGEFDFRFDSLGFARALCEALELPVDMVEQGISDLHQSVARRRAYAPSMFVDTGFKRKNEPVFVLAAMESKRWISFERTFRDLPAIQQICIAGKRAKEHFEVHDGVLPLWGEIQRYVFFYAPEITLYLNTHGQVVENESEARIHRARLSVNGRLINCDQILDQGNRT